MEIVNYETAKLAKEVGFDEYQIYSMLTSLYNKEGQHTYFINYDYHSHSALGEGYISAPTRTFLQTWLRDKHGINVWIEHGTRIKNKKDDEESLSKPSHDIVVSGRGMIRGRYVKYDVAFDKALIIALDLLKKSQQKFEYFTTDLPGLEGVPIIQSHPQLIKENSSKDKNHDK